MRREQDNVVWALWWCFKVVCCFVLGVAGGNLIRFAFAAFDVHVTDETVKYTSAILGLAFIGIAIGAANRDEPQGGKS